MSKNQVDDFKKGFKFLGIHDNSSKNDVKLSVKSKPGFDKNTVIREMTKAPNNKPIKGSIGYGELERSSR